MAVEDRYAAELKQNTKMFLGHIFYSFKVDGLHFLEPKS